MDLFEYECKIIDDAVRHLITGEDIYADETNKQPMKATKVINRAIQLKSLEIDMTLVMLTKIIRRDKGISADRVIKLLMSDDIGKHLIRILDTYNWSYHGFMTITDSSISKLNHLKKYTLRSFDLYTGFEKNYVDSFVVKMKKHEDTDTYKPDVHKICQKILRLHERYYEGPMTAEDIENGEKIIKEALSVNVTALSVLVKDLFKDKAEFGPFIKDTLTFYERF